MNSDFILYECVINFEILFYFSIIFFFRICWSHRIFVRIEINFSSHFSFRTKTKSIWRSKIFNYINYCYQNSSHTNRCHASSSTIDRKIVEMRIDFKTNFFEIDDDETNFFDKIYFYLLTSLSVNFFKKIPREASGLGLNLIRLRNPLATPSISHVNCICTQWVKLTNKDSFWSLKWALFKESNRLKIERVRIEL